MKLAIQVQALNSDAVQQFEFPVSDNPITIGRGPDSPVPLDGVKLSRNHVAFAMVNGQLTLTDLSSNGVWVNAQSVPKKSAILLHGNEEIAIPGYRLRVRLVVPAVPSAVAAIAPMASSAAPSAALPAPQASQAQVPAAAGPRDSRTMETMAGQDTQPMAEPSPAADSAPPWWHLSGLERTVLAMIALAVGLFYYYYSIY